MIVIAQFNNIKFLREVVELSQRKIAETLILCKIFHQQQSYEQRFPGLRNTSETKQVILNIDHWLEDDLKSCFQLSASRMRFVKAYIHKNKETFLVGLVHEFEFFLEGGLTEGLFDNLKTADAI